MDHLELENVIYVAVMPDDSGSIGGQNPLKRDNTQDVIDGHNNIVQALKESEQARMILFKTQSLNSDTALNSWVRLDKVVPLTRDNFKPTGTTPLYDRTLSLLTSVVYEKTEALKKGHSNVRWGILLITDGDDFGSKKPASVVKLMLDYAGKGSSKSGRFGVSKTDVFDTPRPYIQGSIRTPYLDYP